MAESVITDRYALYNGDCVEVLPSFPDGSVHLSIYSPPFAGLYNYSSSENDMSNCASYDEFLAHYEFLVREVARVTMPGRLTCIHCMDVATPGQSLRDLPGDIIRLHEKHGFVFHDRHCIWKEPLRVAVRTRALGLTHRQIMKDSTLCRTALPDYVVVMRKRGTNPVPVNHPMGLFDYAGGREVPPELLKKFGGKGHPSSMENRLSQWIWRQYASAFWDDVRINRVLPYKESKEPDDEKHVHPLQLDVIDRCVVLKSNPGETVLTPYMGVGSETYGAVKLGRRGVGVELKGSYFKQAVRNMAAIEYEETNPTKQPALDFGESEESLESEAAAL